MAHSKRGYVAMGFESTAGLAVIPNKFFEIISETLSDAKPLTMSGPIANTRTKNKHVNQNANEAPAGEVVFEADPNTIGYWLKYLAGSPVTDSTPTEVTEYLHVFTAPYNSALGTFTLDIAIGDDDSIRRYVGCKLTSFAIAVEGNVYRVTAGVMAQYEFITARLLTATTASGTTLNIDQVSGLVVGDVLNIGLGLGGAIEEEKAVETLTDETAIEVAATANNHAVNSLISIKRQTPVFKQVNKITLTGTSGTANVGAAGGLTKLATFNATLTTTASDFVTAHAAAYLAVGIVVTSSGAVLIFTGQYEGTGFIIPTITNASGNLAGTVAYTNPYIMKRLLWVGSDNEGSIGKIAGLIGDIAAEEFEGFTLSFTNDIEARNGTLTRNHINRYPKALLDKSYECNLTLNQYWKDLDKQDVWDFTGQQALEVEARGELAGSTIRSGLKIEIPNMVQTKQPLGNLGTDEVVEEEAEFAVVYDATQAYEVKFTLTNKVSSYA